MNQKLTIEHDVLTFLAERTQLDLPSPDHDLVADGTLDSLLLVELVLFIEERYGITPALEELELANFASPARVAAFVASRLGAPALEPEPVPAPAVL